MLHTSKPTGREPAPMTFPADAQSSYHPLYNSSPAIVRRERRRRMPWQCAERPIEAEVGKAKAVGEAIRKLTHGDARATAVDTVTGPFDVIVQMEADDLDKLGRGITDGIQQVEGVQRTTTCLVVRLG